jgi:hypothetical protein
MPNMEEIGLYESYWLTPITALFKKAQAKRDRRKARNLDAQVNGGYRVITRSAAARLRDDLVAVSLDKDAAPIVAALRQELEKVADDNSQIQAA